MSHGWPVGVAHKPRGKKLRKEKGGSCFMKVSRLAFLIMANSPELKKYKTCIFDDNRKVMMGRHFNEYI